MAAEGAPYRLRAAMLSRMDTLRALAEANGFFTRAQALEHGESDRSIRRALRSRIWTRVRPGAYTFPDLCPRDEVAAHLLRARAVMAKLGRQVALSHSSAALVHGLELYTVDLTNVHVTRLDGGAGRTEAGVVHHEAVATSGDVQEIDGHLVMRPARAALETATLSTTEGTIVALDSGLRHGLYSREELEHAFVVMAHWPRTLRLEFAIRFADGRAESVGESRSRYLCYVQGLPAPQLQFPVYDERTGALIGTTDLAWVEQRLLGEFDGRVKYGRLLRPGEDPGDAVFREKVREDALREATGFGMVRLTWGDLAEPAVTAERIRRALRRSAA